MMYAIVGTATLHEGASPELAQRILDGYQSMPGFRGGTYTRSMDRRKGRSLVLFSEQDQAQSAMETMLSKLPADAPVTIDSMEVWEVVAHA